MILRTAALTFALSAGIASASDVAFPASKLFEWCASEPGSTLDAYCGFYISGFVNGAGFVTLKSKTGYICLPPNFTGGEGREIFIRKMRDVPKLATMPADAVLGAVLSHEFPCSSN